LENEKWFVKIIFYPQKRPALPQARRNILFSCKSQRSELTHRMKYYLYAFVLFLLIGFGLFFCVDKYIQESVIEPPVLTPPMPEKVETIDTSFVLNNTFLDDYVDTAQYKVVNGYTEITWKTLSKVKFHEKYVDSLEMPVPFPIFHSTVEKWSGKPIQISGYVIPIEETGDESLLVLSANSFANCFFCGNAGPETIMDIKLKKKIGKRMKQDDRMIFRGKLKLNATDLYYLNYILEDAEVVEE
jgi:hypothetical protein